MAKKKKNISEAALTEKEFIDQGDVKKGKPPTTRATEGISFRVFPDLALRYRQAIADRSVTMQEPYKKQDVLAQALTEWLDRNGY